MRPTDVDCVRDLIRAKAEIEEMRGLLRVLVDAHGRELHCTILDRIVAFGVYPMWMHPGEIPGRIDRGKSPASEARAALTVKGK